MLWNNNISQTSYSTFDKNIDIELESIEECNPYLDEFLLNEHSFETRFCLNKKLETYPSHLEKGMSEYYYSCDNNIPEYYFSLQCDGEEWLGKKGRDKCEQLFKHILSTFKFTG